MPVAVASLVAAVISFGVGRLLNLSMYMDGLVKVIVYLLVYLGWSFVCKPDAFTYTLSLIPNRIRFWERKIHKNTAPERQIYNSGINSFQSDTWGDTRKRSPHLFSLLRRYQKVQVREAVIQSSAPL